MVKFLILVVGVGLLGSIKVHSYSRSSCNETSENAEALCNLASPSIIYDSDAEYVEVERTADINGSLWIGYVRGITALAYKGCIHIDDITAIRSTSDIRIDPGVCYSYCKTQFIGMWRRYRHLYGRCYCINDLPDRRYDHCDNSCDSPEGVVCGNFYGRETRVSIYKARQIDMNPFSVASDNIEDQNCLAYNTSGPGFYFWSSCYHKLPMYCVDDTGSPKEYPMDTWANCMEQCLYDGLNPVYPETNVSNTPQANIEMWLGIIRSYTISNRTDKYMDPDTIVQGHIRVGDGREQIQFEVIGRPLYALCYEGDINEECTLVTLPPPTIPETQRQNDGPKLVAVYVVIPIALLTAALVIAFFVWRKRRASGKNGEDADYIDPGKGKTSTRNAMSNVAYQDDAVIKPQPKDGRQHDYLVLEPQNEYADINASEQQGTTGEEYDTTGSAIATHNDTGNVYNRLGNHVDDTYNHTNQHDGREDDTYNHANQHERNEDDTYNHTNQHDRCEDETYNHIGTGIADATYGTASAQSNSKRRQQETDNDYNELNIGDDTYNQPGGTLSHTGHGINADDAYDQVNNDPRDQVQTPDSNSYSAQIPKRPPPTPAKGNPKYDYAYTKAGPTGGSTAPATFGVGQLPNAGSYELAKAPMEMANYELAKPPGV